MMSRTIKTLCAVTALGLTASTFSQAETIFAAESASKLTSTASSGDIQLTRLAGKNRFDTAVAVSQEAYKNGSDFVVIANGLRFPDALCAAPLAKKYDAPILLSETNTLSLNTINEIKRLNPKYVFIVGGKGVVSQKVEEKLKEINKDISITRIGGKDRYETAILVANKLDSNKVVVASGMSYADALSISPIAAEKGMPILLTRKDELPSEVKDFLKDKKVDKTFIIGQTGVISENVEDELENSQRIGGQDRYETNIDVMKTFANEINFKKVYAAIGGVKDTDFADALTGAAVASQTASPVILIGSKKVELGEEFAKEYLYPSTEIIALGGEAVLKDNSLTPYTLTAVKYEKDGETKGSEDSSKPENVTGNVDVLGNNITVQNQKVTGNVYVEGDNASLKNVDVDGTIYVNPGKDGSCTIENVKADRIKVLSGAEESIHLKNVTLNTLEVSSVNAVKVDCENGTDIEKTVVTSPAKLKRVSGSFGDVVIKNSTQDNKVVELEGRFSKVELNSNDVVLKVSGHVSELDVTMEGAKVVLESGAYVTKLVAYKDMTLTLASTSQIGSLQAADGVEVAKGEGSAALPKIVEIGEETSGSSSSSSSSRDDDEDEGNDGGDEQNEDKAQEAVNNILNELANAPIDRDGNKVTLTSANFIITGNADNNTVNIVVNKDAYPELHDLKADELYEKLQNSKGAKKAFDNLKSLKQDILDKEGIKETNSIEIKDALLKAVGLSAYEDDGTTPKSDFDILKELKDSNKTYNDVKEAIKGIKSLPVPEVTINDEVKKLTKITLTVNGTKYSTGSGLDGLTIDGDNCDIDYNRLSNKLKEILGLKAEDHLEDVTYADLLKALDGTKTNSIKLEFDGVTYTINVKPME